MCTSGNPDAGAWLLGKERRWERDVSSRTPHASSRHDDQVLVWNAGHGPYSYYYAEDLLGPIGNAPEFPEAIDTVRARIAETVGRIPIPHKVRNWHPAIERLLKEDEKRREKQLNDPYPMSWDKPLFDSPFERRRLRILNSLFFAVAKMNGKSSVHGREAREIRISFFQQHLPLSLGRPKKSNRCAGVLNTAGESSDTRLCLSILKCWGSEEAVSAWQDDDAQKLEACMTDIAVQVILTAEIHYRESALRQYQWRVQRKAELEEEERKRRLEAERAEKERQKRVEQGRVDRLLRDAAAFHQAGTIRNYIEAIRLTRTRDSSPSPDDCRKMDPMGVGPSRSNRSGNRWEILESDEG